MATFFAVPALAAAQELPPVAKPQTPAPAVTVPAIPDVTALMQQTASAVDATVRAQIEAARAGAIQSTQSAELERARAAIRAQVADAGRLRVTAGIDVEAMQLAASVLAQQAVTTGIGQAEATRAMAAELLAFEAQQTTPRPVARPRGTGIGEGRGIGIGPAIYIGNDESQYERGISAVDSGRWERAIDAFTRVIDAKGRKADGAHYWKAFAQYRLTQRREALATLQELEKSFPKSRYLNDARALAIEVRQASGQTVAPEKEMDEELKIMALQSVIANDPDRGIPLAQKFIEGTSSPRMKDRALFLLAQTGSPRARDVLIQIAKGSGNPDLQIKAIRYLGMFRGDTNQQALADIYAAAGDPDVKRQIIRAFMMSGDKARLLQIAKTESSPELRIDAIRQLGAMGGQAEVWELYQREMASDVKQQMLRTFMMGKASDKLLEVARAEKDAALRKTAIQQLGMQRSQQTGTELAALYKTEKDKDVKKAILNALFMQQNATALVAAARSETDPDMKKEIVQKLSMMKSKEATDYLMELLK
jgi:TolA-binding protein